MTQPQLATSASVAAVYQQQTSTLRDQITAFLTALWQSLGTYRNAQMGDFTGQAVPVVEAAMGHMQAITSAYLATLTGMHGGSGTPVATRPLGVADVRNGADPADVYGRPFHLVWRQLAASQPLDGEKVNAAIQSGLDRAVQTAVTDLQLAKTQTSRQQLAPNRNVVGYRRQLEGPHSCALCIVAATRRYHKADLMPIHPACDCSVVPIFGGEKADLNLDPQLLEAAHATVAAQFGADSTAAQKIRGAFKGDGSPVLYRDVLIEHSHGELGPVIAVRGQSFTGPADIPAA